MLRQLTARCSIYFYETCLSCFRGCCGWRVFAARRVAAARGWFLDVSSAGDWPVDYVVPLPGDDNTRTLAAAALFRHGYAHQVAVLQGVPSPFEADGVLPAGAEITRRVLIARGVGEAAWCCRWSKLDAAFATIDPGSVRKPRNVRLCEP